MNFKLLPDYAHTAIKEAALLAKHTPKILCNFYSQWKKYAGINEYDTLEKVAETALQKSNSKKINLVCHSQGGLLGIVYAMQNPEKVKQYTTFGTPFKGTPSAYAAPLLLAVGILPKSAQQFLPRSNFTRSICSYLQTHNQDFEAEGLVFKNIRALYDEFVPYPASALKDSVPEGKNITEETIKECHVTMLHNRKSLKIIEDCLSDEASTIFIPGFALNRGLFEDLTKKMKYEKNKTFFLQYDYAEPMRNIINK